MLVTYIRNKKNRVIGVVVAVYNSVKSTYQIGWSLCKKCDTFNKGTALTIALGRAVAGGSATPLPQSIKGEYQTMVDRSARYFKQVTPETAADVAVDMAEVSTVSA